MEQNYRSSDIDKIMAAMAKSQGMYKPLKSNEYNNGVYYANLRAIIEAVREGLSANGLAFYQYTELLDEGSGAQLLKSTIGHESGQYISSYARVITGSNERQNGNIYEITKRRQALMLLGIAPSDTDPHNHDDNAEELLEQKLIKDVRKTTPAAAVPVDRTSVVSKDQYEELCIELEGYEDVAKSIMEAYDIKSLADLPKEQYHYARSRIMKIKKIQDEYQRKRKE